MFSIYISHYFHYNFVIRNKFLFSLSLSTSTSTSTSGPRHVVFCAVCVCGSMHVPNRATSWRFLFISIFVGTKVAHTHAFMRAHYVSTLNRCPTANPWHSHTHTHRKREKKPKKPRRNKQQNGTIDTKMYGNIDTSAIRKRHTPYYSRDSSVFEMKRNEENETKWVRVFSAHGINVTNRMKWATKTYLNTHLHTEAYSHTIPFNALRVLTFRLWNNINFSVSGGNAHRLCQLCLAHGGRYIVVCVIRPDLLFSLCLYACVCGARVFMYFILFLSRARFTSFYILSFKFSEIRISSSIHGRRRHHHGDDDHRECVQRLYCVDVWTPDRTATMKFNIEIRMVYFFLAITIMY